MLYSQRGVRMIKNKDRITGYILIALSAFCFSLNGILSSFLFKSGIKTFDLIILQNISQLLILLIFYSFKNFENLRITKNDIKIISLQGLFASTPTAVFYYIAIQKTNTSVACLLLFTNPIFVTLYYVIFEKQRNNMSKIMAVAVVFLGSALVLNISPKNFSDTNILGIIAGILSSISYAFYNVYAEKKLKKYPPGVILFYCTIVVFVLISAINFNFYLNLHALDFTMLKFALPLSTIANIAPVILLYSGIKKIGAQSASIIATGEVPFTIILSFLVLKETLNITQIFGSVLIVGSILSLTLMEE